MTNEQLQKRVNELEARETVSEYLRGFQLHELTRDRLMREATTNILLSSDGSLDKQALKKTLGESVKVEQQYLTEVSRNRGGNYAPSTQSDSEPQTVEDYEEAWTKSEFEKVFIR